MACVQFGRKSSSEKLPKPENIRLAVVWRVSTVQFKTFRWRYESPPKTKPFLIYFFYVKRNMKRIKVGKVIGKNIYKLSSPWSRWLTASLVHSAKEANSSHWTSWPCVRAVEDLSCKYPTDITACCFPRFLYEKVPRKREQTTLFQINDHICKFFNKCCNLARQNLGQWLDHWE